MAYGADMGDGGDMGNMCHNSDMGDKDDYHRCYYNNLVLHTAFGSRPRCSTSLAWIGRPTRAAVCQFKSIKSLKKRYCIKKLLFLPALRKRHALLVCEFQIVPFLTGD